MIDNPRPQFVDLVIKDSRYFDVGTPKPTDHGRYICKIKTKYLINNSTCHPKWPITIDPNSYNIRLLVRCFAFFFLHFWRSYRNICYISHASMAWDSCTLYSAVLFTKKKLSKISNVIHIFNIHHYWFQAIIMSTEHTKPQTKHPFN